VYCFSVLLSSIYICFILYLGTNFPFSNVFIDPDFAETSSLNTIYQLIGRAGRVGKSFTAKVGVNVCACVCVSMYLNGVCMA
jgi:hypothetical protein